MQGSEHSPKAPLGNNARPLQPLHHRTVRTNIDFKQSKVRSMHERFSALLFLTRENGAPLARIKEIVIANWVQECHMAAGSLLALQFRCIFELELNAQAPILNRRQTNKIRTQSETSSIFSRLFDN